MTAGESLGRAAREAGGRIVAALAARYRDLDLAEEGFADACARAAAAWTAPPRDPAAWLYTVADRCVLDRLRRRRVRERVAIDPSAPEPTAEELMAQADAIPDERLRLIFVCCHPAIAPDARAAVTLKLVCGLSTERLARAFLVEPPAMLQRITRAKRKVREAGVPFEVPGPEAWPERLDAVLSTLEVAYAQAYEDAAGSDGAVELVVEALRLSRVLVELMPGEPEVLSLAATIRFGEARRPARLDEAGAMVPLDRQDVSLWRGALIDEGLALLSRALDAGRIGPRQVMAMIHAAHASRAATGLTPWADILALYDQFMVLRPGAVTAVNRAVAVGKVEGPQAGLAALAQAASGHRLDGWPPYQAARAALSAEAGLTGEAAAAYRAALDLAPPPAERLFLERALAELALQGHAGGG